MGKAGVWPRRSVRGWDGTGDPELYPVVELRAALTATYDTDAHFVPYTVVGPDGETRPRCPRINKAARAKLEAAGYQIVFDTIVLDIDCPEAHKGDGVASQDWRHDQDDLYENFPRELRAGMGRYDTRGGYRLLWTLTDPLEPDAYIDACAALRREVYKHDVVADELPDWGRCYRLPRVVRDGVPQDLGMDLDNLGTLQWLPPAPPKRTEVFAGIEDARGPPADASRDITGNRNMTLTRLAGSWRRTGLDGDTILTLLRGVNAARCKPPLEDSEVAKIARSVSRYDPEPLPPPTTPGAPGAPPPAGGQGPRFFLGDEEEIARAVADDLEADGEDLVFDRARLWQYGASTWQEVSSDRVSRVVQDYSGEQIFRGVDRNGDPKLVPLKVSAVFVRGTTKLLQARKTRIRFFDNAPAGLMFANGFIQVDADGAHLRPASPDLRQLHALPFDYVPGAIPRQFVDMLEGCWRDDADCDDKVQLLREWSGAALLGQSPMYQRALVKVGGGANGKSKVGEIITALFPAGTVTAIPPQDMDNEYRRAKLAGARLNCVSELPEADILISEPVKAMITGEMIVGRHIREAPFEFKPTVAHMFAANTLPGVRDMSVGFWRRWLVLEFNRQFGPQEADRTIAERIIATELPAIASWVIDGAAELAARGYYEDPPSSVVSLADWRRTADQVASFVSAACRDLEPGEPGILATDFYNEYSAWAGMNGHRRMSRTNFGKRLVRLGVERSRSAQGNRYNRALA